MPLQLERPRDVMETLRLQYYHYVGSFLTWSLHPATHADLEVRSNVKKLQSKATLYSN